MERKTKETDIRVYLNLDGSGKCSASTGVGFFDHMLEGFARHGLFDLEVDCRGDLHVDCHHSIEDVGIALGQAFKKAVGDKSGIRRYGSCTLPMDETLILCAVDLSGRPFYASDVVLPSPKIGDMESEMLREFFYALSYSAEINLHFVHYRGENSHHIAEACFKSIAKALAHAVCFDSRVDGVWSTKGAL